MFDDEDYEFEPLNDQASGGLYEAEYSCAFCGSENHTFVDPSQGEQQEYTEDCQTCCRPNILSVSYDEWEQKWLISSELE